MDTEQPSYEIPKPIENPYEWYAKVKRYEAPGEQSFSMIDASQQPNNYMVLIAKHLSERLTESLRSARNSGIVPTDVLIRWTNVPDAVENPMCDVGRFRIVLHGVSAEDSQALGEIPELTPIQ